MLTTPMYSSPKSHLTYRTLTAKPAHKDNEKIIDAAIAYSATKTTEAAHSIKALIQAFLHSAQPRQA